MLIARKCPQVRAEEEGALLVAPREEEEEQQAVAAAGGSWEGVADQAVEGRAVATLNSRPRSPFR